MVYDKGIAITQQITIIYNDDATNNNDSTNTDDATNNDE